MRLPGGVSRFQYPGRARPQGRYTTPAALFFFRTKRPAPTIRLPARTQVICFACALPAECGSHQTEQIHS